MSLPLPQLFVRAILYKLFIFNSIPCFVRGREELDSSVLACGGEILDHRTSGNTAPQRISWLKPGAAWSPFLVVVLDSRT